MDEGRHANPALPPTADDPVVGRRVRGLLHGLAVGEVLGAGATTRGVLRHGVATQLACFTAAASIRTSLHRSATGTADARADLLDAYRRWAWVWTAPGRPRAGATAWIDEVPLLTHTPGEAEDTVRGLSAGPGGTRTDPVTTADGWHALARALPLAAQVVRDASVAAQTAIDSVALTHGPRAFAPAGVAVLLAGAALRTGDAVDAVAEGITSAILLGLDFTAVSLVDDAVRAARETPSSPVVLRAGAADGSSASTLWGAVYCLLSHPGASSARAALALAAASPHPVAVSAVTGALLGAVHGDAVLPQAVLTRVDLAYVIDRLARDLTRENTRNPDGSWGAASDPAWRARYGIG
ncbi:ADP-ribosylglycohydrolase [Kineococcus radiotolerans SRS30216 = ATCC BAA-149]|uniref:ADP-ribosylglycohydrolase n=1 Tax=Kineococcus radiotolerans (strain ATCC BAA-149 / DSM 14245 / SRS30216) TaxID=266940 RepID=A6WGE5_KINRD|nr:ADP-ribosylglycohydrolase [Kineococcus radiotolerans SRS30216 = ATCC BAA-149]